MTNISEYEFLLSEIIINTYVEIFFASPLLKGVVFVQFDAGIAYIVEFKALPFLSKVCHMHDFSTYVYILYTCCLWCNLITLARLMKLIDAVCKTYWMTLVCCVKNRTIALRKQCRQRSESLIYTSAVILEGKNYGLISEEIR